MSARKTRTGWTTAGFAAALLLTACGSAAGAGGPTNPAGSATRAAGASAFAVTVAGARFPPRQRLSQPVHLVIAVRNAGSRALPNVAITICNVTCAHPAPPGAGTQAAAFSTDIAPLPSLANPSRPLWIITRAPGRCGYGCQGGAQGGAATAYSNTWTLGRLAPGRTATFDWGLTAVRAGRHVVAWEVSPGLSGPVVAHGRFTVRVATAPARYHVDGRGAVVTQR